MRHARALLFASGLASAAVLASGFALAGPLAAQPRIGGFLEYDNLTYLETPDDSLVNARNQVVLQTEVRHYAGDRASLFGAVEFRFDAADESRDRVYLDEAYVDLFLGPVDLRIGRQVLAWGRADGFNPTDNLTAWDFSDILDTDDEELGLAGAAATWYVGDWSAQGVIAPTFTPSVLPDQDSRWWPDLPSSVPNPAFPEAVEPFLTATYEFANETRPDEGLDSFQYAIRVSGTLGRWDVSASWFDGFDDLPSLHLTTSVDSAFTVVSIAVEPRYHRRRAIGADFATAVGSFGLHWEAAYYLTADPDGTDPAIDDRYLHYVVGGDRTFYDLVGEKDLLVLLEWSHEVRTPDRGAPYRATDLNHVFRKSIFGRLELGLDAFSAVDLEGVYDVATDDWYVQPGASWSFADGLELLLDLDLLGGPGDSFFGSYEDNSRLHLRLKYSF